MSNRLAAALCMIFIGSVLSGCAEKDSPPTTTNRDYAASVFSDLMGDVKISLIEPIKGGASGSGLYKITADNHSYVLRILPEQQPVEAIKREFQITTHMGNLGVSPKVYASSPEKRALVMDMVQGGPLWGPNLSREQRIQLAQKLKLAHQPYNSELQRRACPRNIVDNVVNNSKNPLPPEYQQVLQELAPCFARLESRPYVLTHTDLNPGNIIKDRHDLKIIDWEDIYISHPYLDLASVMINYNLSPKELDEFLKTYATHVDRQELLAAYKVHNFIISIRLLRMADMMEGQRNGVDESEVHAVCNLFKMKKWPEVISMLNDRDAVYALSELFLDQSKQDHL
jgi:aminoglycoside phosphotransferase (APT) family kinase protein